MVCGYTVLFRCDVSASINDGRVLCLSRDKVRKTANLYQNNCNIYLKVISYNREPSLIFYAEVYLGISIPIRIT